MLAWIQFDLVFSEDLVQMYVEHHVAVRCLRSHVSLPVSKTLKSVMDDDKCVVIVGANCPITRLIEWFHVREEIWVRIIWEGFVQELNTCDCVRGAGVACSEGSDCIDGLGNSVPLLPVDGT